MSQWQPYYLLGSRQLGIIAERIQFALPGLLKAWWTKPCPAQVTTVNSWEALAEELRSSAVRYLVRSERAWMAVLGSEHAWHKLSEQWLGCSVISATPLIEALRHEFCVSLFKALVGESSAVVDESDWPLLPTHAMRAGGGSTAAEVDFDGVPLTLITPIEMWPDLMQPVTVARKQALEPSSAAMSGTSIDLNVLLSSVRVSMAEMAMLEVGDVINLQDDLSGRVRVTGKHMELTLSAVLGQQAGKKAISIQKNEGSAI